MVKLALAPLSLTMIISACAHGQVALYVDDDAASGGDGLSWTTAFNNLQDALACANSDLLVDQVLIAGGSYRPDQGAGILAGDRTQSFRPRGGLELVGGFAGYGAPNPNHHDAHVYPSILDGDLFGDDAHPQGTALENTDELLLILDVDGVVTLSSLWLTRSNDIWIGINGSTVNIFDCIVEGRGRLVRIYESDVNVEGCTFRHAPENQATLLDDIVSGAIEVIGNTNSSFTAQDCVFIDAPDPAEDYYPLGASSHVYANCRGSVTIDQCTFTNSGFSAVHNSDSSHFAMYDSLVSGSYGVAVKLHGSDGGIIDACEFRSNRWSPHSEGSGGAVSVILGSDDYLISNCIFNGNASPAGAGINLGSAGGPEAILYVESCVFVSNTASDAASIDPGFYGDSLVVANCIMWNNYPRDFPSAMSFVDIPFVSFSLVRGGWEGLGNIDIDPGFVSMLGIDGIPGTGDEDFHLLPDSPCIDSGSSGAAFAAGVSCDFDGNPRFYDDPATLDTGVSINGYPVTDMGAFEYRSEVTQPCPTDLNGDCLNDTSDLGLIIANFGLPDPVTDINGDGITDTADLGQLIAVFGQVCP